MPLQPNNLQSQGVKVEVAGNEDRQPKAATPSPLQTSPSKLGSAARLPHFADAWLKVTNNKFILRIVSEGYKIQFISLPPPSTYAPRDISDSAFAVTAKKVNELYLNGALTIVSPSPDQYISHIFTVPKKTPGEF